MATILAIGIATLDIINVVDGYPEEDSKIRALQQRVCRGGNATNTLVVLSQLGHHCTWGGVWVNEPDGNHILADLHDHQIDTRYLRIETQGKVPTSYILLNQRNGSRTIVHYRRLPEFTYSDFEKINLAPYDWIHFEGRNIAEIVRMVQRIQQLRPTLPISIEIEKSRPQIEQLFSLTITALLFSKNFAHSQGYTDATSFLTALRSQLPQVPFLIAAWGSAGGYAIAEENRVHHSPAYSPPQIVDTLGAGDTFNAGIIDGLCRGQNLADTLNHACRVAGIKCGQLGLSIKLDLKLDLTTFRKLSNLVPQLDSNST